MDNSQNSQNQQPDYIEIYAEALIKAKGFGNLNDKVMIRLKIDLMERLTNRLIAQVLNLIPVDKLTEMEKLVDKSNVYELIKFVKFYIKDTDEVMAKVLIDFRKMYLGK